MKDVQKLSPSTNSSKSYDWGVAFNKENYSIIPNEVLSRVLEEMLVPSDLLTYAYLLSKTGAMEASGTCDYTIVPEAQVAKDLKRCVRSVRASVSRLVNAQLIERQDTPGYTRTRMLVKVDNGNVVVRNKVFPPPTLRVYSQKVAVPSPEAKEDLPSFMEEPMPRFRHPEDEEPPF